MIEDFLNNVLNDISTELLEEFDLNFERKSFFSQKWKDTKRANHRGSLLLRSGKLRRSINVKVSKGLIKFSSSLPYARLHNEGGKIIVTEKMKKFFWYLYRQAEGGILYNINTKQARNTKQNRKLSDDAKFYKAMALKKVGDIIIIEKRQFLGHHPDQDLIVQRAVTRNIEELNKEVINILKQKP